MIATIDVVQVTDEDTSWRPPWGDVLGMVHWAEAPRVNSISGLSWEHLSILLEELEMVAG